MFGWAGAPGALAAPPLRRDPFEQAQSSAGTRLDRPGQREARLGKQRLHCRVRAQTTAKDHEHQHVVQLSERLAALRIGHEDPPLWRDGAADVGEEGTSLVIRPIDQHPLEDI